MSGWNWPGLVRAGLLAVLLASLSACATVPATGAAEAQPPRSPAVSRVDPWEGMNRRVFAFNEAVDEAVLRPVAEVYRAHVPQLLRTGVGNFFGNLRDAWSAVNHLLQGKPRSGAPMVMRVLTNSVFGFYGVLDPATEFGLVRQSEDFGQTLARWGLGQGPYLVLPLLGPSTLRDTAALPLDRYGSSPVHLIEDANTLLLTPLQLVHARSELLSATRLAGEVSLDKYLFVRDAYLSRRLDQIHDGAPPLTPMDTGDFDDAAEPVKKP